MCCLNLGSVLNISKILLNFLHFAKKFWTKYLKSRKRESDSTKKIAPKPGWREQGTLA